MSSPSLSDKALAHIGAHATAARARLLRLSGWQPALAAVGLGVLSVLAMAPFFVWPVLFITLPGLIWLLDAKHAAVELNPAANRGSRWQSFMQLPAMRAANAHSNYCIH